MIKKQNNYRFCIRTFRGYECTDDIEEARQMAKNMIMDIITDKWSNEYWWARIIDNWSGDSQLWVCPEIGKWAFSRWLHLI